MALCSINSPQGQFYLLFDYIYTTGPPREQTTDMKEGLQVQNIVDDRLNHLVGCKKNEAETIQRNRLPKLALYYKPQFLDQS
jgi:hypothetical protein